MKSRPYSIEEQLVINCTVALVIVLALCFVVVALTGCTTVRPLTTAEVKEARLHDTVRLQQVNITQPTQVVEVRSRPDTVYISTENRTTETRVLVLDTAALDSMVRARMAVVQSTLLYLLSQHNRGSDSVRVMQTTIEIAKKEAKADQQYIRATQNLLDVPLYGYALLLIIAAVMLLVYWLLKRTLYRRRKRSISQL